MNAVEIPCDPIGERDLFNLGGSGIVPILNRDAIRCAADHQDQISPLRNNLDVIRKNVGAELDSIDVTRMPVVIVNLILTVTAPKDIHIVLGSSTKNVVPAPSRKDIRACAAVDFIVPLKAIEDICAVGSNDVVIRIRWGGSETNECRGIPHGAIRELDRFDSTPRSREPVRYHKLVRCSLDTQRKIIPGVSGHSDISGQNTGIKEHLIFCPVSLVDGVLASTATKEVCIISASPVEGIAPNATAEGIIPGAGLNSVVSVASEKRIVTSITINLVIPPSARDRIRRAGTNEVISPFGRCRSLRIQVVQSPYRSIGELDSFHLSVGRDKPIFQGDTVGTTLDFEIEIPLISLDRDFVRHNIACVANGVRASDCAVVVEYRVLSVTTAKKIGVVPRATFQVVVAGIPADDIVPRVGIDNVVPTQATDRIYPHAAIEYVGKFCGRSCGDSGFNIRWIPNGSALKLHALNFGSTARRKPVFDLDSILGPVDTHIETRTISRHDDLGRSNIAEESDYIRVSCRQVVVRYGVLTEATLK